MSAFGDGVQLVVALHPGPLQFSGRVGGFGHYQAPWPGQDLALKWPPAAFKEPHVGLLLAVDVSLAATGEEPPGAEQPTGGRTWVKLVHKSARRRRAPCDADARMRRSN